MNSIREFTDAIRANCLIIAYLGADNHLNINKIELNISLYEDLEDDYFYSRTFKVKCKNIKEYKNYINLPTEEIIDLHKKVERDIKIEDIIG